MKKRLLPVLGVIIFLLGMLTVHFVVPTKVTATDETIAMIRIFDGSTGIETRITDEARIQNIVTMFNDLTFLKSGVSLGYIGYSYDITYYAANGEKVEHFIVNNERVVRCHGFFYKAQNDAIDFTAFIGL